MPSRSIMDRLSAGDILLMDGATGSELGRRGVNVSKGSTMESLAVWSGSANIDAPNVVRQVHEDYLKIGADIIISNNFWTSRPKLETIGEADNWEAYTRAGGEIALQARDNVNPEAYVAGGVAPPDKDVRKEFEDQSRVLADVGVDFMLPEYVGTIKNSVIAVDACATSGLPVFLGVCHLDNDGVMEIKGEKLGDLGTALRGSSRRCDFAYVQLPRGYNGRTAAATGRVRRHHRRVPKHRLRQEPEFREVHYRAVALHRYEQLSARADG